MKAETPAQGISIDARYNDAVVYNIECDCGSKEHSVKMWVEINSDPDIPGVEVTFYVDTYTPFWSNWKDRLQATWNILFKGLHRQQHSLILDRQAATNLSAAITKTIKDLEKKL